MCGRVEDVPPGFVCAGAPCQHVPAAPAVVRKLYLTYLRARSRESCRAETAMKTRGRYERGQREASKRVKVETAGHGVCE